MIDWESDPLVFASLITLRHPDARKRVRASQGPIRAQFWREWADQREPGSPNRAGFARIGVGVERRDLVFGLQHFVKPATYLGGLLRKH